MPSAVTIWRPSSPPSLDALTTITGLLRNHHGLANRGWRMPSLERLEQRKWEWWASSQSLQHVGGHRLLGEACVGMFERVPRAATCTSAEYRNHPAGLHCCRSRPCSGRQTAGCTHIAWVLPVP
ncbi:unnamed protein product [Vitrella brassicaformis CCMP3155]|uniref:Uncharacterized protein n=1 Tax=Vitrella brassicaformis (strain CCMP3155) TaxID=1169540 RepID=A0A0G4GT47_VITBC|nr:unnamed protein product [Vitrella brassicaformis CCMP3155]|eukprot:CEM33895.1 unnamed protein product [Vitrella brassicaformis CCMP3155]